MEKKRKRRWFSYSLRTGLLLILGFAIWLAWLVPRARHQKEVADWIRTFNRQPGYSFEFDSLGKRIPNAELPVPTWLVNSLGVDYFSSIEFVHLDDNPVRDISLISSLTGLRHFELSSGEISDITPLQGLTKLDHVSLSHNPIDNISAISNLSKLRRFYAFDTKIHDLTPLRGLTELENVVLSQTDISDLSPLSNHPNLSHLDVSRTPISDVSPLKDVKSLQTLNVSNTNVPGADIDELQGFLPNCKITR